MRQLRVAALSLASRPTCGPLPWVTTSRGPGQRGQGGHGQLDVLVLDLGQRDLAALQECVAAHSHHEAHVSPRSWRPWPP